MRVDLGAQGEQFLAAGDGGEFGLLGHLAPALHHGGLLLGGRVVDEELEEEAVGLRLGQRVGAFLLDRVLRGHHEERLRGRMCVCPPMVTWRSCMPRGGRTAPWRGRG
jgi:hypothetical protein